MKRVLDFLAIAIVVVVAIACIAGLIILTVLVIRELIISPPVEYVWPVSVVLGIYTLIWALGRVVNMGDDA